MYLAVAWPCRLGACRNSWIRHSSAGPRTSFLFGSSCTNEQKGPPNLISVVINAKNEERWIVQAISSVEGFADEVVVADMASVDRTAQLARSAGAIVINVPEFGYVEPARRVAIDAAS